MQLTIVLLIPAALSLLVLGVARAVQAVNREW